MQSIRSHKKWHKYLGLPLCLFCLIFGLSGVILNHRHFFSSSDVSRRFLPPYLHLRNWNLGSLKASLPISPDSILIYGSEGIFLTDSNAHHTHTFFTGMQLGVDNRNISSIVKDSLGNIFAASTFNVYKLDIAKNKWRLIDNIPTNDERIMDMNIGDGKLVIMTRSNLITAQPPYHIFKRLTLPKPSDYDGKVSLFRTTWLLHSGEIAGLAGKIIIDILGIIFVLLSITGIILFCFPKILKKRKLPQNTRKVFKYAYKYHDKVGLYIFYPLLFLTLTGWFLRPPLLLTIISGRTRPIPYSTMDSPNPWHDKLRSIRYDQYRHDWIFYTSDGFYQTTDFLSTPQPIKKSPEVSVMGINVFRQQDDRHWLIGSFSGLVIWDRVTGNNYDYTTHKIIQPKKAGPPNLSHAISGYTSDFKSTPMAVKYNDGISNPSICPMPSSLLPGRISLWHLSIEFHTGRIYSIPLIGPLFIFLVGLLFITTLLTGYIISKRVNKKKIKKTASQNKM